MGVQRCLGLLVLIVTTTVGVASPAQAASIDSGTSVSPGGLFTCGINTVKNLYCWGDGTSGQIGDAVASGHRVSPVRVGGAGVWASISAGNSHACGITVGKNLYC